MDTVEILLAGYHSERFLNEQLDSILAQDDPDWQLLFSDGGSTDRTWEIMREYAARDSRIHLLPPANRRLSAPENFSRLLEASTAPYLMFCDHDDVWFPEKISLSRLSMHLLDPKHPRLVFTDKAVTDESLQVIAASHEEYECLDTENGLSLNRLLAQNVISGCTMMFDRALAEAVTPLPFERIVMHDHYLALAAAAIGNIGHNRHATMYYRQHGNGLLGAKKYGWQLIWEKCKKGKQAAREQIFRQADQALALYEQLGDRLSPGAAAMLRDFGHLREYGYFKRHHICNRYHIEKAGRLRQFAWWLVL